MGKYVDITGISDSFLGFMGYVLVSEDDEFTIYTRKGEEIILSKIPPIFLFVEDDNDVPILRGYRSAPCPPWN
jgi:hypothetical protein